ncbi:MAG: inositol monophosphatase [Patescibacteria group bacterium]|jgi:myo-inositol-1(or 4)-monophosphatase
MRITAIDRFIETTIRAAGKSAKCNFGVVTTGKIKTGIHDIVTEADYECERIILKAIQQKYPQHNILSEEAGLLDKKSDYTWIVDPIDGTNNFAKHIPLFGIIITLAKGNQVLHGAIYDPIHDEFFYAKYKQGSYCNKKRIQVSKQHNLDNMIVSISNIPQRSDQAYFAELRKKVALHTTYYKAYGSAAQVLSAVACGRIDAWILGGAYPWDIAAGALLVTEAGGKITTLTNQPWHWPTNNQQIVVANPKLHHSIIKLINHL